MGEREGPHDWRAGENAIEEEREVTDQRNRGCGQGEKREEKTAQTRGDLR